MAEYIEATPANMRKYGGPNVVALDLSTYFEYSATSGDYFWLPDNEPLRDHNGEPLILAVTIAEHHEPLPGPE